MLEHLIKENIQQAKANQLRLKLINYPELIKECIVQNLLPDFKKYNIKKVKINGVNYYSKQSLFDALEN